MCNAAQRALAGAFGEQGAQGAGAAQLHAEPAIELGVAGEQRGSGAGLAQALRQGGGIGRALADRLPGSVEVDQGATHAGFLQQEQGEDVAVGVGHGRKQVGKRKSANRGRKLEAANWRRQGLTLCCLPA